MSDYQQLEQEVYEALLKERKKSGLNFFVRRKFLKNMGPKIFLGTEKSKYFAFTVWNIPNAFPGASEDLISYRVVLKGEQPTILFKGFQRIKTHNNQNKWDLELIRELRPEVEKYAQSKKLKCSLNSSKTKYEWFEIGIPTTADGLARDLIEIINETKPIVDKKVEKLNRSFPDWEAENISNEDFNHYNGRMLEKRGKALASSQESNYWIFQGSPEIYNLVNALKAAHLKSWKVAAHKTEIKIGDKVIIWQTGAEAGCYALAEVTSEVGVFEDEELETRYYYEKPEKTAGTGVKIKITHYMAEKPALWIDIKDLSTFSNFNAGNRGTNFTATKEQYETLLDVSSPTGEYKKVVSKLNPKDFELFMELIKRFVQSNEVGPEDLRISLNVRAESNRLVLLIGSRYSFSIESREKKSKFSFIHPEELVGSEGPYEIIGNEAPMYWNTTDDIEPYLENALVGCSLELKKNRNSPFRKYSNSDFTRAVFGTAQDLKNTSMSKHPLNTIFYGPPGTGKTYNTISRAAEIVLGTKPKSYDQALKVFNENLREQIEFITFHQNYSYEDFIQGIRPDVESKGGLSFEREDGVFARLSKIALKNLKAADNPVPSKRQFEEVFLEFMGPLSEGEVEELPVKMKKSSYVITDFSLKTIRFKKTTGNTDHTLSVTTLEKMYDGESLFDIQGLAAYYRPLLDNLLKLGKKNVGNLAPIPRKNFVLIIDEINRANISRVFGELITLIEPDKRFGGELPLPVQLPTGEEFIVPSNLYIIGTMNTADKSIALLDIALRRRFQFESMYPRYDIEGMYDVEILKSMNKSIIDKKGHDFQIGHSYFMGDNKDLNNRMNFKVIPLLMEYFMNDVNEVKEILKTAGLIIDESVWPLQVTGLK